MSLIKILQENKDYEFICESKFICTDNNLYSLKRSPSYVKGFFDCSDNNLKTLEGSPRRVDMNFLCINNNLESLEGSPEQVNRHFFCNENNLKTLDGAPTHIAGDLMCRNNPMLPKKEIIKYYLTRAVKGTIYSDHGSFTNHGKL